MNKTITKSRQHLSKSEQEIIDLSLSRKKAKTNSEKALKKDIEDIRKRNRIIDIPED